MSWNLPVSLNIGGTDFRIRSDYRAVIDILIAADDPELPEYAKTQVMLEILYPDWKEIPEKDIPEAIQKAVEFIDCGQEDDGKQKPKMMDWEQDADLIIPAVNKIAGVVDIRAVEYMHWWTFMGYFMEIGDSLFSQVLGIRHKKAKGKKLEKWETEFFRENRSMIQLKEKVSEAEAARMEEEKQALQDLFG